MGVSSFDIRAVEAIRRLATAPHLSILVGAGASLAAQLPSWEALVERLLPGGEGNPVASLLVRTQGYQLAAEAAFAPDDGPEVRLAQVEKALYVGLAPEHRLPSRFHQAIAQLVKARAAHRQRQVELFTTNYDDLLEQALTGEGVQCNPRCRWYNHPSPEIVRVHHIHGFLGREEKSDDIVVGSLDYDRVAQAGSDWPGEELGASLAKGPILFVGASMTDPNLLRILAKLRNRSTGQAGEEGAAQYGRHVLLLARQGLQVPKKHGVKFHGLLQNLWERYRVQVVLLDDFSDQTLFVRECAHAIESGRAPDPRARVAALYEAVMDRFPDRQAEFHQWLGDDMKHHLGRHLGKEARTLSLWLCDGAGKVRLFGSSGRVHRTLGEMTTREDHHEDGWVVTEAMALEGTKVKPPRKEELSGEDALWNTVGAAPLQPALGGGPNVTVGALSFGTARPWSETDPSFLAAGIALEQSLVGKWEARLSQLYDEEKSGSAVVE